MQILPPRTSPAALSGGYILPQPLCSTVGSYSRYKSQKVDGIIILYYALRYAWVCHLTVDPPLFDT